MSLSSNEKMKNPATKFIEWKGSTGEWKYYDKLGGQNVIKGLVNVSFVGSSLSSWIESKVRISDANVLTLTKDPIAKKKGATSYFVPTITSSKPEDESIIEKAKELDVELQEFLTEYRNKPMSESHINKTESDGVPSFIPPKEVIEDNEKLGLPF